MLTATAPVERLVIMIDRGAPQVRVDALEVVKSSKRPRPSAAGDGGDNVPGGASASAGPLQPRGSTLKAPQPQLVDEVSGAFAGTATGSGANAEWRLAIWRFMVERTLHNPLAGVGFGRPTAFPWHNVLYDARRNDPTDPNDVTGPHNSFVNILFRMGLLGALPLLALVAIGGWRVLSALRSDLYDTPDRARLVGALAVFVFVSVVATFSVALEGPFMGMFFWVTLALLLLLPKLLRSNESTPA